MRDPTSLYAIIDTASGEQPRGFAPPQRPGAYGAVAWGQGGPILRMWGAGFAKSDDTLRAAAVLRLLEIRPPGTKLRVYSKGLADQLRYVSRSLGLKADRKTPFDGFEWLKPVQEANDRGEWELQQFTARQEPGGYHLAREQAQLALRVALKLRYRFPDLADLHSTFNLIIATDKDPDPFGMVSYREAACG